MSAETKIESLAHCFPLITVALRLYVFYIDRISISSLEQFCVVIAKLCSANPDFNKFKLSWKWNWAKESKIKSFLPDIILSLFLDILCHCFYEKTIKSLSKYSLIQLQNYATLTLRPTTILR